MLFQGSFHRNETKIALVIWVSAVLYAIYQFTRASQKHFEAYYDHYEDFTVGWSIFKQSKKDKADFEWETINFFFRTIYPVIVCYLIVSEIIRCFSVDIKFQQYFQTLLPILYLTYFMGYQITLTALLQPILFYLAAGANSKLLIWICNLVCLVLITIYKIICAEESFLNYLGINHFEAYLNIGLICWMNLKCTSYFLQPVNHRNSLAYLSYCFYFPTLFTGPFIGYEEFNKQYDLKNFEGLDVRLTKLGCNILRCVFWMVFVAFWLHFVYVNATSFQLELVKSLDLCSLCGYGYLMGQFFHIKYVVIYGLSTSLASFDNVSVPSLPRCIGRVHLYSDMWKYFDPGLYNFLKKYILIPSLNIGLKKFMGSILCFLFVFIWHGLETYILIWAALNFVGVVLEDRMNSFYSKKLKCSKFIKTIDENSLRRLKNLLAAPLLAMSAVSNFYFFAGKDVGDVFVEKSLSEPFFNKILVLSVLYCCCEVSTELRDIDAHKM